MNIKDILRKVVGKEELTTEELDFLGNYDESSLTKDMVSKDTMLERLGREKKKIEPLQSEIKSLQDKLLDAESKISELNEKGLTAEEKKEQELAQITKDLNERLKALEEEKTSAEKKAASLERSTQINTLASQNPVEKKFQDPGYLEYLMKDIDLTDEDAVKGFFSEQIEKHPERFVTEVKSGAGSIPTKGTITSVPDLSTTLGKLEYLKDHTAEEYGKALEAQNASKEESTK